MPPTALARAVAGLSDRYREREAVRTAAFIRTDEDVLAYAASRLPATYAALTAALGAVHRILPEFRPASMLDLGAGPGTASWAAHEIFPDLEAVSMVEPDSRMADLGRRLARYSAPPLREATWHQRNIQELPAEKRVDLMVGGYVLGEIEGDARRHALDRLMSFSQVLVFVEPGTPYGYSAILEARVALIEAGWSVVAPCPHDNACPMAGSDWCHFSARLSRSRIHRRIKAGSLSYEDEKFSYVAARREGPPRGHSRIVRHSITRPGKVRLELCAPGGLRSELITRRDKLTFAQARHARWGDEWPVIDFSKPRLDEP